METAGYLHWFNNRRIHSAIGDVAPAEREAAWYAARGGEEKEKNERRRHAPPGFPERGCRAGCGRRDGTGPPPPASTVLRIALARDGLRPPLTPETSGGPQSQQSGQPKGLPRSAAAPSRPHAAGRWPALHPAPERRDTGTRQPPPDTSGHLFDHVNRQKNYKADRRSAAELSLNQSRGAPPAATTPVTPRLSHSRRRWWRWFSSIAAFRRIPPSATGHSCHIARLCAAPAAMRIPAPQTAPRARPQQR